MNNTMCENEPVKCCESACCCEKPSKLDNFRYWWKHEKNIWFERKKVKFNYFIVIFSVPPIYGRNTSGILTDPSS